MMVRLDDSWIGDKWFGYLERWFCGSVISYGSSGVIRLDGEFQKKFENFML